MIRGSGANVRRGYLPPSGVVVAAVFVPDPILQRTRRLLGPPPRGQFFVWVQEITPPTPLRFPLIAQARRTRFSQPRRGRFFFTGPPVTVVAVIVPPQFLTRRRQSLGPTRRGRFFSTGPTIAVPPKLLTQRRQGLRIPRRGQFFWQGQNFPSSVWRPNLIQPTSRRMLRPARGRFSPTVPAVVAAPTAVWEPNLIAPAQRRLMLRPRHGQFLFAGQNFPPRPWVPPIIQQPQQHWTMMIRRGRFYPVVPTVAVVAVITPPSFLTRRRQPLVAQRRGRFFERLIPPAVCPATIARRRAGLPPSRRGRYFWHGQNFPAMPPIVHRIRRVYRSGLPQARFRNRFYGPWWIVIVPPSEVWATGDVAQSGVSGVSRTGGPTGSVDPGGVTGHGSIGDPEHGTVEEEHVTGSVRPH